MKNYVYIIVLIVITFLLLRFTDLMGIPFWVSIIGGVPVLFYIFLYSTMRYNFRTSLNFEKIPGKGYEARLSELNKNSSILYSLRFRKFDEFYWKIANDLVVYVYHHEYLPILLCDYHFGQKNYYEFVSKFEDGVTLTSSNAEDSGLIPRNNENLLQIFPNRTLNELFAEHQKALEFLHFRKYVLQELRLRTFRNWFISDYRKVGKVLMSPISPIKLLYRNITNNKRKYMKSVHEQFLARTLQLK